MWFTAARLLRIYDEWLTGEHAWNLQVSSNLLGIDVSLCTSPKKELPEGGTLLGVILSLDKTNISVMSDHRMAHPLLLSLANIASD